MIGLVLAAQVVTTPFQACAVPPEAYAAARELQATGDYHDNQQMIDFMICLCGPEGAKQQVPTRNDVGQVFLLPVCNRLGWTGAGYWPRLRPW